MTRGFSFGKKGKGNRNARETLPSFENEETGIPGNGNWHCCSRRTTFAVNPPSGVRRPLIYCSLVVNLHRRLCTCLPSRIVPMKGGRKIIFVRNAVEQSPKTSSKDLDSIREISAHRTFSSLINYVSERRRPLIRPSSFQEERPSFLPRRSADF